MEDTSSLLYVLLVQAANNYVNKMEEIYADPSYESIFVVAHAHGVAYTGPKDCVEREKLKGIIKLVADDLEKKGLIHGSKISGNTDGETVK
jgi:hypothetical protein